MLGLVCPFRHRLAARPPSPASGLRPLGEGDCQLTREAAIAVLTAVTCAPITRTVRGIRSEVELGPEHGLPERCAISCDNLITIPVAFLYEEPVGRVDGSDRAVLDRALRYALDVVY